MRGHRGPVLAAAVATALGAGVAVTVPAAASGATLVGGRAQAAIRAAFDAQRTHRGETIVSIRASTVAPAWSVVRYVTPDRAGNGDAGSPPPHLRSAYFQAGRGTETAGAPPAAALRDLQRPFSVAIVYSGSGREAISYERSYASACAGQGELSDRQTDLVSPMSWSVRYVVGLDDLLAAVRNDGTTTLVPRVGFDAAGSSIDASETVSHTTVDTGCDGAPSTVTCTTQFRPGGPDPAARLTFTTGGAPDVGIPLGPTFGGACDPGQYVLGGSLWDAGAAAVAAARLGLLGGSLPADPYAPVSVSWPGDAALARGVPAVSPCAGEGAACNDTFQWSGTVRLVAIP